MIDTDRPTLYESSDTGARVVRSMYGEFWLVSLIDKPSNYVVFFMTVQIIGMALMTMFPHMLLVNLPWFVANTVAVMAFRAFGRSYERIAKSKIESDKTRRQKIYGTINEATSEMFTCQVNRAITVPVHIILILWVVHLTCLTLSVPISAGLQATIAISSSWALIAITEWLSCRYARKIRGFA